MNKNSVSKELTETKLEQLKFWEDLKEYTENNPSSLRITRKARPQHWYSIGVGISQVGINFIHNTRTSSIAVDIYIKEQEIFEKLYLHKDYFESLCEGKDIDWKALPGKKASRILTYLDCDLTDESLWENHYKWLIETGEIMLNALQKTYKK